MCVIYTLASGYCTSSSGGAAGQLAGVAPVPVAVYSRLLSCRLASRVTRCSLDKHVNKHVDKHAPTRAGRRRGTD
jgi:hypothetical protein